MKKEDSSTTRKQNQMQGRNQRTHQRDRTPTNRYRTRKTEDPHKLRHLKSFMCLSSLSVLLQLALHQLSRPPCGLVRAWRVITVRTDFADHGRDPLGFAEESSNLSTRESIRKIAVDVLETEFSRKTTQELTLAHPWQPSSGPRSCWGRR
jgi:hypothetical protein